MLKLIFITISFLPINLFAWESNNFTSRRKIAEASEEEKLENLFSLNDKVNKEIVAVIKKFNKTHSCTDDLKKLKNGKIPLLYSWIDDSLGGIHANIEKYAEESDVTLYDHNKSWLTIAKNLLTSNRNIYNKIYGLQGAMNLNGHVVGADKLGHFVDQGHELMVVLIRAGFNKSGFVNAMKSNNYKEESYYGLWSSGIKSYGDMAASFSGLKFFYNLLHGNNPQVTCNTVTGKYKLNYYFDWSDHINDSWDEGINCSFFDSVDNPYKDITKNAQSPYQVTDEDEKEFLKYLAEFKPPITCPVDKEKCRKISKINCSNYFVSPKCLATVYAKPQCKVNDLNQLLNYKKNKNSIYEYNREILYQEKQNESGHTIHK